MESVKSTLRTIAVTVAAIVAGAFNTARNRGALQVELKPGDTAPDFSLQGSDGHTYRLRDLGGHIVVLAWFPKAFTGG